MSLLYHFFRKYALECMHFTPSYCSGFTPENDRLSYTSPIEKSTQPLYANGMTGGMNNRN
jgi:hypothetical protein